MTFFGSVAVNYSLLNPYAEEDYMNITVSRDWDTYGTGSLENMFLDLLDSGLDPEPKVDTENTGWPYRTALKFMLIEVDAQNKWTDFAEVQFEFFLGKADWADYSYHFWVTESSTFNWFHSVPPVGTTVKALLTAYISEPQDPNPAP